MTQVDTLKQIHPVLFSSIAVSIKIPVSTKFNFSFRVSSFVRRPQEDFSAFNICR
jgi:hypothetical protein